MPSHQQIRYISLALTVTWKVASPLLIDGRLGTELTLGELSLAPQGEEIGKTLYLFAA
jgi:hypothetical protein